MSREPDYKGTAEVFWSGGSQAVRLPAQCRFETTEVEIIKVGNEVTLRPRGQELARLVRFRLARLLAAAGPAQPRRGGRHPLNVQSRAISGASPRRA